jgi:hypothetical protein
MADVLKANECHSDVGSPQNSASPVGQGVSQQCWQVHLAAQVVLYEMQGDAAEISSALMKSEGQVHMHQGQ